MSRFIPVVVIPVVPLLGKRGPKIERVELEIMERIVGDRHLGAFVESDAIDIVMKNIPCNGDETTAVLDGDAMQTAQDDVPCYVPKGGMIDEDVKVTVLDRKTCDADVVCNDCYEVFDPVTI